MKKCFKRKSFTLIEVMVAILILSCNVGVIFVFGQFVERIGQTGGYIDYNYTALNLAREILEFGESVSLNYEKKAITCWPNRPQNGLPLPCHPNKCCENICAVGYSYKMIYDYNSTEKKYTYNSTNPLDFQWVSVVTNPCGPAEGADYYERSTEEYPTENPFNNTPTFPGIGDIKAKGLVPQDNPDSVKITYEVDGTNPPYAKDYRKHTVTVEWQDKNGRRREVVLATIPLNQTNDTYKLSLDDFWWN